MLCKHREDSEFQMSLVHPGHGSSRTRQTTRAAQQNSASGETFYSIEPHMAIEHFATWLVLLKNWIFTFTEFQFKQPRVIDGYCIRQHRDTEFEINENIKHVISWSSLFREKLNIQSQFM